MTTELKPCPFCGNDNAHWDDMLGEIECASCGIGVMPEEVEGEIDDEAEAIAAWNRRTDPVRDELLAACKKYGDGCHPNCDHDPINCSCGWSELARAIAKAEGGGA